MKEDKSFWEKISQIGVRADNSLSVNKKIRLSNQLASLIFPTFILLAIYYATFQDPTLRMYGVILELCSFILVAMTLVLNAYGYFKYTLWYLFTVCLLSLGLGLLLVGRSSGGEFALIVVGAATLVFFNKFRQIILANTIIAILFLVIHFYLDRVGSLFSFEYEFNYVVTFFISIICQVAISYTFVNENSKSEQRALGLLSQLETNKVKIEEQNTKLIKINKELESFAYATSHDLRAPLRNIVSFSDLMLRRERDKLSEDGKEYLNFIRNNAKQMNSLVNDILSHAALNSETILEMVDLNQTIASLKQVLAINTNKQVTIKYELLPAIHANRMEMNVLFQNLIENGLKYNESDHPYVHIFSEHFNNILQIKVKDNGIGIPLEYQEKVFGIFKRLHLQKEYEGTGIGLATCRKIVEKYDGRIRVESEGKDMGTIFIIELPSSIICEHNNKAETNNEIGVV